MAVVVRYVCHHCGAAREGAAGEGWVRCDRCDGLVAFDWQAWFSSPAYAAYLREALKPEHLAGWQEYQARDARAGEAAARGDLDEGLRWARAATEQMVAMNPTVHPSEVSTDAAYRERFLRFCAWTTLQQKADPVVAPLQAELMAMLRALDRGATLATLRRAAELITRQQAHLATRGDRPEDPDGMPPPARTRAMLTQFLGGYVQLLSPDEQRELLVAIHGAENVHVSGTTDVLGLYREWRCPGCGLLSLQQRAAQEHTCPGCSFRRPVRSDDVSLEQVELRCSRCGASLTLEAGERERCCAYCGTWTRRLDVTGEVERTFGRELAADLAQRHRLTLAALPADGAPGVAVTPQNRRALQLAGLVRQAPLVGALVTAQRWLALVAGTLGAVDAGTLDELRAAAEREGGGEPLRVIDEARRRLGGR